MVLKFILGLLENTFATMTNKGIFMRGDIVIDLQEKNTGNFNAIYTFNGIETYTIEIDTIDLCNNLMIFYRYIT